MIGCMTDTSPARRAVDRYVEVATSGGKGAIADLFAADATFHNADGGITRGREAIRAVYEEKLANITPAFHVAHLVEDGDHCWVELANGSTDDPQLIASDHFTVDAEGLITRMAVFLRPRPPA